MTRRVLVLSAGFAFALAGVLAAQETKPDPKSPVKVPTVQLYGSLADTTLATAAPASGVIVTAKGWQSLVEAWGIKNPAKVDFDKELLVVATTQSDKLTLTPRLGADGDLRVEVVENKDIRGGLRYAIRSVSRDGVKTINGKPLPKE